MCDSFDDGIPTNYQKTCRAYVAGSVNALRKTDKDPQHVAKLVTNNWKGESGLSREITGHRRLNIRCGNRIISND